MLSTSTASVADFSSAKLFFVAASGEQLQRQLRPLQGKVALSPLLIVRTSWSRKGGRGSGPASDRASGTGNGSGSGRGSGSVVT